MNLSKLHGRYSFRADGKVTRAGQVVGQWRRTDQNPWSAGAMGYHVQLDTLGNSTECLIALDDDLLIGNVGNVPIWGKEVSD